MAAVSQSSTAVVRELRVEDLPAVASLFVRTFRRKSRAAAPSGDLIDHLKQIYFDNPWFDPDICSKVFVDDAGSVQGFIGVNVQRMVLADRPIRAAFAGSLVVADPARYPLAGARLLRSFLSGPQDLSVTETANATAMGMWQKLAIPVETDYSLNWFRVMRPASALVSILERRSSLARLLLPLAKLADAGFGALTGHALRPIADKSPKRLQFTQTDRETFNEAALVLSQRYRLRPDWDRPTLDWFSRQAASKRNFGTPCYRLGRDAKGNLVAAYAYFRQPHDLAWMLQSFVEKERAGDLIDDMMVDAYEFGCSAIRGTAQPWLNNALVTRKTLFYSRVFFLADARDKSLLEPIRAGEALVSGLAGESWMRLIGDRFD